MSIHDKLPLLGEEILEKDAKSEYTLSFFSPDSVNRDHIFHQKWNELVEASSNLYAFYQSPEWLDYSLHTSLQDYIYRFQKDNKTVYAAIYNTNADLVGLIVAQESRFPLKFRFRAHACKMKQLYSIRILGGQPLFRDEENLYVELTRLLFAKFPGSDVIQLQNVLIGSCCWRVINESKELKKYAKVHFPNDLNIHPRITIQHSFEQYLQFFKSKTRYNLRRQVKQLREYGDGNLDLIRFEHERDVNAFLDEATAISAKSWQHKCLGPEMNNGPFECDKYAQFAKKGVLRSYILRCGNKPCAFVRGFQCGNVFYYSRIGYDEQFTAFSPGTVCLYLMIEDLHNYRSPGYINFQEGLWDYKKLFMTDYSKKIDVLLIRKNARFSTKILISIHKLYQSSLQWVKKIIRGKHLSNESGLHYHPGMQLDQ